MKKPLLRFILLLTGCFTLLIAVFTLSPSQSKPVGKNTICLNMIVKNESAVIEKCLNSTKNLIDYWVIVDTGSTDGTQEIIKNCMKGIPGELHERPWVNFGHNRDEALQLAKNKAEYSLFIDADETLVFSKDFKKGILDKDVYGIVLKYGQTEGIRDFLVRNALDWHWKGVLHEILDSTERKTSAVIQGVFNLSEVATGARAKNPRKHLDDAEALKKGLEKEPGNLRYQFHLGQCYVAAEKYPLALEAYQKRISMGEGSSDDYFYSLYMSARLQDLLEMPILVVTESYNRAHMYRPWRLEPLFYLGCYYVRKEKDLLAYETLKKASLITPRTDDFFNIDTGITWQLYYQLAGASWRLGKSKDALEACKKTVQYPDVPESIRQDLNRDIIEIQNLIQKGL